MQRSEKKTGTCYPDRRKIIVLQRKYAPGSPEWDFPEAYFILRYLQAKLSGASTGGNAIGRRR